MRHRVDHRKLSRTASHRKALLRNLVTALFLHERIETTVAKAKEARRLAERLITYAKRNNLHSRRLVAAVVNDETVVKKIFDVIAPQYATRHGGYTRILRTRRRLGDAGEMGILELVKSKEQKDAERRRKEEAEAATKPKKKSILPRKKKAETAPAEAEAAPEKPKRTRKPAAKKAETAEKAEPKEKKETKAKSAKAAKPAAKKERKPRVKTEEKGAARTKGGGATAPRKTRGSQRGK